MTIKQMQTEAIQAIESELRSVRCAYDFTELDRVSERAAALIKFSATLELISSDKESDFFNELNELRDARLISLNKR